MSDAPKLILGIESSCDETAIALVNTKGQLVGQTLYSQTKEHTLYGGVVPEIAARQHILHIEPLLKDLLKQTGVSLSQIDAIAATSGPGLIGGVIVGLMTAKSLAAVLDIPLYAINHLEGHALSVRLEHDTPFPYLLFLMSGGHCQILVAHDVGNYELLGQTIDDAIGEAFDKTAKMMGLGYPGGPQIEQYAKDGTANRFNFPRPFLNKPGCDMSFSGLKTAIRTTLLKLEEKAALSEQDKADVAASLQQTISDIISNRLKHALDYCQTKDYGVKHLVIAGGVAANNTIRNTLKRIATSHNVSFIAPSHALCTDNAAMIAWAAAERINRDHSHDSLTTEPKARWPLYKRDTTT